MNPGDAAAGLDARAAVPARPSRRCCAAGSPASRDDRYPTVTEFVDALAAALGPVAAGPATQPWLDRDPELTQPGPRPTAAARPRRAARADAAAPPRAPARGARAWSACSRWPSAGAPGTPPSAQLAPTAAHRRPTPTARSRDRPGGLGPRRRARRLEARRTPTATFPALSVGTSKDWATGQATAQGVFVGAAAGHRAARAAAAAPRVRDRRTGHRRQPGRERLADRRLHRLPGRGRHRRSGSSRSPPTRCSGSRSAATTAPSPTRSSTTSTPTASRTTRGLGPVGLVRSASPRSAASSRWSG